MTNYRIPKPNYSLTIVMTIVFMFSIVSTIGLAEKTIVNLQNKVTCGFDTCTLAVDVNELPISPQSKDLVLALTNDNKALYLSTLPPTIKTFNLSVVDKKLFVNSKIVPGSTNYWILEFNDFILDPWFNSSWIYRVNASIKSSVSIDLLMPRNITIDTLTLINASKMKSDCSDLRITNESDAQIPFYIESGCNTTKTIIWYKTTTKADNSSLIWLYYGNPTATSVQASEGVWSGYSSHYDMAEASGTTIDDDGNINKTMTFNGGGWTNGFFGTGVATDGVNDFLQSQDVGNGETAITLNVWTYIINASAALNGVFIKGDSVGERQFGFLKYNSGDCNGYLDAHLFAPSETYSCANEYPTNRWVMVTARWNGTTLSYFLNGTLRDNDAVAGMTTYDTGLVIGKHQGGSASFTGGYYDNALYTTSALSDQHIKMIYDTATKSELTSIFGAEETYPVPQLTITKLYLNGLETNISISNTTTLNMTGIVNTTGTIKLLVNNTLYASGTGSVTNLTNISAIGLYNITAVYDGAMGFNASYKTLWATITYTPPSTTSNATITWDIANLEPNYKICASDNTTLIVAYTDVGINRSIICSNGCDSVLRSCKPDDWVIGLIVLAIIILMVYLMYRIYKWL